ncbi:hypothetical protein [Polaromonas sp. CF318]|nr:hypothetical protein [Polaromonas sp. CF318]
MDFSVNEISVSGSRHLDEQIVGTDPCAGDYKALQAAGLAHGTR